ncbi:serine/threonine protein kinase [Synechococcus sp. RSCCF101]|uniref:protein kinase domain-containing protein n=1 Tax=Synechococcus sp. RSCCF101 TaxID=2511069 RepID=UPI0012444A54|nr:protein kinase [Synechococcus sp. RSCCF101]QEY32479.1 serine/threonine protein kinase [Synechococcus sp. RSCCF101]
MPRPSELGTAPPSPLVRAGSCIGGRFELVAPLGSGGQGQLWRGIDRLASSSSVVLRGLEDPADQSRLRELWPALQGLLHPQIPRFGALIEEDARLWIVREWQEGRTYAELLQARSERQMVFGAGEVLLLLRQVLPVLSLLHGEGLVHTDLNPSNLLRRERDGLPVLLDVGLLQRQDGRAPGRGATAGFAPAAQGRGDALAAWMDLHALGVSALVLLSGDPPQRLLEPTDLSWRLPTGLDGEPRLRDALARLVSERPAERFRSAADALEALEAIPVPDSTGPVARSDRTVPLAPAGAPAAVPDPPAPSQPLPPSPGQRARERDQAAEGRLWPVVIALLVSALVGTGLGWLLLSRDQPSAREPRQPLPERPTPRAETLPPAEVDQRQALLSRLRALQVDRGWFLSLVDASLMERFPERQGRPPSDSLADAPLRRAWNDLAEEWLARVEQLPPELRSRLGSFSDADWQKRRADLQEQGISAEALAQLVSSSAASILPQRAGGGRPPEPFRQLWTAAAEQRLATVDIERIEARSGQPLDLSTRVSGRGARLVSIAVPEGHQLVLGVNGTPLMRMTVFAAEGAVLEPDGPLRVVQLPASAGSPVQVLITNDGVSSGLITLSCRADPDLSGSTAPAQVAPGLRPGSAEAGDGTGPSDSPRGSSGSDAPPVEAPAGAPEPLQAGSVSEPAPGPSAAGSLPDGAPEGGSEALQR